MSEQVDLEVMKGCSKCNSWNCHVWSETELRTGKAFSAKPGDKLVAECSECGFKLKPMRTLRECILMWNLLYFKKKPHEIGFLYSHQQAEMMRLVELCEQLS